MSTLWFMSNLLNRISVSDNQEENILHRTATALCVLVFTCLAVNMLTSMTLMLSVTALMLTLLFTLYVVCRATLPTRWQAVAVWSVCTTWAAITILGG